MTHPWPERFVYVCSATRAGAVNFAPIVHAGAERIASMVIFRGLHPDPEMRNANDVAQAKEGGKTLRRVVALHRRQHGLNDLHTQYLDGDPQDVGVWARHMQQTIKEADGLPVAFCVTGGTKLMALGGVLGGALSGFEKLLLVHVDDKTLATRFIDGLDMVDAAQNGGFGLEKRIALAGYSEPPDAHFRRLYMQRFYRSITAELEEFYVLYLNSIELQNTLYQATRNLVDGNRYACGIIDAAHNQALAEALQPFRCLEDFTELDHGVFNVQNEEISKLLRGGWLEALLYNRVVNLARGQNDVEVACGLAYRPGGAPEGEIDVALLVRGQLHAIEAKTSWFGEGEATEKTLHQVQNLKHTILGVPGRMLVVNPRVDDRQMRDFKANVEPRAKRLGVEFYLGVNAVDEATREVKRLIEGA